MASEAPTRQNRKLLIDLGQFFEILEYSSSSELPGSKSKMFGPGLQGDAVVHSRREREIAQTSVLPEPTRVEGQEFGSTPLGTPAGSTGLGGALGGQVEMVMGVSNGGAGMESVGAETEVSRAFAIVICENERGVQKMYTDLWSLTGHEYTFHDYDELFRGRIGRPG